MKQRTFVFLLVTLIQCVSLHILAQPGVKEGEGAKDKIAFNNAYELYNNDEIELALLGFYEFMNVYPQSTLIPRAHYNIGYISFEMKKNDVAKAVFLSILSREYNELEDNSLMEPYALYKHNICRHLAEIFLTEKNYKEAEKYIRMFDKEYPYQHFCGNEWAAYHIYKALLDARVYDGKNQVERAINVMLPYLFDNGLASNQSLMVELITVLENHYTSEEIKKELNNAYASLTLNKNKATILIYGKIVEVDDFIFSHEVDNSSLTGLDLYKKKILTNELFKKFIGDEN